MAATVRFTARQKSGSGMVPSHVDQKGNEKADELADEGVEKHDVTLAAEGKNKKPVAKRPAQQKTPHGQQAKRQRVATDPHQPEPNPRTQPPDPNLNPHPNSLRDNSIPTHYSHRQVCSHSHSHRHSHSHSHSHRHSHSHSRSQS